MDYFILYNSRFNNTSFAYGEEKDIEFKTGNAKYCEECGNAISMLEWLPPYDINISKKSIGDFIFGTFVGVIVSKRVKMLYEKSSLIGLTNFRRVNIYYRNKKMDVEYYYPEIDLVSVFVDLNLLDIEKKTTCNFCQIGDSVINKINGISFLQHDNIGKDIFFNIPLGQADIFVSEAFKNFIESNNLTNTILIEISKYRWDSMNPVKY